MRTFLKKGIAVFEVIAISITLIVGFNFGMAKNVQAATDGTITVNQEIAVKGKSGESKKYTFTAPESGVYYFTSAGDELMYGFLYIDGNLCKEDCGSGVKSNFLIDQYLTKGQECIIEIQGFNQHEFNSNLVVYDKANAQKVIVGIRAAKDVSDFYCELGEQLTLNVEAYDLTGEKVNIDLDKCEIKWYTEKDYGEKSEKTRLDATGTSYTIDKIKRTDFWEQDDYLMYYTADMYYLGEFIDFVCFEIENKAEYIGMTGEKHTASEGDSITLTLGVYDYYGNRLDVSQGYTLHWYKEIANEYIDDRIETDLGISGPQYTINSIDATDFIDQGNGYECYYMVSVYKNDKFVGNEFFYIYPSSYKSKDREYTVSKGDKLTLTPYIVYENGNEAVLSGDDLSFEWCMFNDRNETDDKYVYKELGNGSTYTIDSIDGSEFYNKENLYIRYKCTVYKKGEEIGTTYFYIYEKEEQVTRGEQPTTGGKPISVPIKVKAPTKAKITKVMAKKKSARKVKLSFKKTSNTAGYQVAVYTTKKNAKNNKAIAKKFVKKTNATIRSKKFKNKKMLYVRVRAYALDGKTKVYGKWSSIKKVKIK